MQILFCSKLQWSPVGWDSRIHLLHLYKGGRCPHTNECPSYDSKHSKDEALALESSEIWSTPLLPLFPGPLWPGVVALDKVLAIGEREQALCKQMTDIRL